MTRWIAALLVVFVAFAFTSAQEEPEKPALRFPLGGSKSQLPFDVIQVDGKTAWRITGRGSVRIEELVAGLASAVDVRITYDQSGASRAKGSVPYVGSDSGTTVANAELADYVSELLSAEELTLVGHSTGRARVVKLADAASYARPVSAAELATLPPTEWVSITRTGMSGNAFPDRLFDGFNRAYVFVRYSDGVFNAAGRVEQIRNVNAMLESVASVGSDGMTVKAYDMPGALKASDAARAIDALFQSSGTTIDDLDGKGYRVHTEDRRQVNVTVSPTGNRLVVRATEADHRLVQAALDAMK
jgi:hypothetical protein